MLYRVGVYPGWESKGGLANIFVVVLELLAGCMVTRTPAAIADELPHVLPFGAPLLRFLFSKKIYWLAYEFSG